MNLLLGMKEILAFITMCNLIIVVLLGGYLWRHHDDDALNTFFVGKCAQTCAWFLACFHGLTSRLLIQELTSAILLIGYCLESAAWLKLMRGYGRRARLFICWVTAAGIVIFAGVLFTVQDHNIRVFINYFIIALLLLLPMLRMMHGRRRSPLMRMMSYAYLLLFVSVVARAVTVLLAVCGLNLGFISRSFVYWMTFIMVDLTIIVSSTGFILLLKEVSDRKLMRLADHDDLTQALNRRAFFDRMARAFDRCMKRRQKMSWLMFDIDHFKEINDQFGHDIGDRVLCDLSRRMYQRVEADYPDGLFVRFGGDEFALLLPDVDEEEAAAVAEQIRADIEKARIPLPNRVLNYTISVGLLTVMPDMDIDADSMYISADNALYGAKQSGRNGVFRGRYRNQ